MIKEKTAIVYFDASTYQALGSRWRTIAGWLKAVRALMRDREASAVNAVELDSLIAFMESEDFYFVQSRQPLPQAGFRYEPWASAIDMLHRFLTGIPRAGFISPLGPQLVAASFAPPLDPQAVMRWLEVERTGPGGWYRWQIGLEAAVAMANEYRPAEVFVVARGPLTNWDRGPRLATVRDWAVGSGIKMHMVPMGNEPGRPWMFPNLADMRSLASATGGNVYWEAEHSRHDFSYLPGLADQMIDDFGS